MLIADFPRDVREVPGFDRFSRTIPGKSALPCPSREGVVNRGTGRYV